MRSKKYIFLGVLITLGLLGLSLPFWNFPHKKKAFAYDKQQLIRFHVIANSDSEADQAMKRKIRDLIVAEMTPKFSKAKNFGEAKKIVLKDLLRMEQIAREEIAREGKDYQVKAMLGQFFFPIKNYGEITLPAGKYEAVRVVIGEGQGANWWCVLFPPVCFHDVSKVVSDNEAALVQTAANVNQKKLQKESDDDSKVIKLKNKKELKVRFKFVEILQKSNVKFIKKLGNTLAVKEDQVL